MVDREDFRRSSRLKRTAWPEKAGATEKFYSVRKRIRFDVEVFVVTLPDHHKFSSS